MNGDDNNQKIMFENRQKQVNGINLARLFKIVIPKWYLFVIAVLISFFLARFYIGHTLTTYSVSALILINDDEGNASLNDQFLQGMGLPSGRQNIHNQIMVLSSRTLTERALKALPFETDIYFRTLRNKLPIYPDVPFKVTLLTGNDLPRNVEFEFTYLGDNKFNLASTSKAPYEVQRQSLFGDTIGFPGGSIRINSDNIEFLNRNLNKQFYFIIHDKIALVGNYNQRLKVEAVAREGTTIRLTLEGTNSAKDVDFINTLSDIFVSLSLDKKNLEAVRRIQFIDDQLVGISDSLFITEDQLQSFRSRYRVMDLSTQGQAIITQSMELENVRARISVENNYFEYLEEYINKDVIGEVPVAPATIGITDPGLMRLVQELAELQAQLASRSFGEKNPLQSQLNQRIRTTKAALLETLNGLRRANNIAEEENLAQIRKLNNQAAALPGTERQLLGIERKFKLNNELYTYLLENRAEQQMQKASNIADSEVIDYAQEPLSTVVSPNPPLIYALSWLLGLAIPLLFLILIDLLNKTFGEDDLSVIKDLPIGGNIPQSPYKTDLVVFAYPESSITEAFRVLRSKMQFFTKEVKSPVILVTSAFAEDGKTYVAINLASVYSLMGKKTILIGYDLRKPKIYNNFELNNEKGISTWLIGNYDLKDIIQETKYENLSIIASGPIPPNPAELTALNKTKELIDLLRKNFDCIIIDSSPIGLVSDTYHLAPLADSCLFVVRMKKTLKEGMSRTLNEMKANGIESISLVLNDIKLRDNHYGYGGKNVYTKDKKKNLLEFLPK